MEISINVFTEFAEFSDKKYYVLKTYSNLPPPVEETRMLPEYQQDTASKEDL